VVSTELGTESDVVRITMNVDVKNIHSLTDFKRNASALLGRAKKSRRVLVLTVNGRAEAVVLGADVYQEMIDRIEDARTLEALKRMDAGEGRPARKALSRIRKRHVGKAV
jgi:prevent-host-death family protein